MAVNYEIHEIIGISMRMDALATKRSSVWAKKGNRGADLSKEILKSASITEFSDETAFAFFVDMYLLFKPYVDFESSNDLYALISGREFLEILIRDTEKILFSENTPGTSNEPLHSFYKNLFMPAWTVVNEKGTLLPTGTSSDLEDWFTAPFERYLKNNKAIKSA